MEVKNRKILFIVNRHAGLGYAKQLEQLIQINCEKNNFQCAISYTKARSHATELSLGAASGGFSKVVAVGGDGTINEVAQGLLHTGIPMGIVPRGSGNGLARHLGIPLKTANAIAALFDGAELDMDIFTVNGKLSLNVSGIGFDGHITNLFGVKSTRGFIGYITLTVQEFFRFREFTTQITTAGKVLTRSAFIIAIANSSQYGNNAMIAPAASVCDGLLHINIVKKVPLHRLDFIYDFFSGSIESSPFCEMMETASLQFKTEIPIAYHVDGEPCGLQDTFDVRLVAGALKIMLPAKPFQNSNL